MSSLSGVEISRAKGQPPRIQSPELDRSPIADEPKKGVSLLLDSNSTFDGLTEAEDIGIEGLKRLATELEQENEELERRYNSEKLKRENVKRAKLTEKVNKLRERKKQLESRIAALADEMDTEDEP
jgi:predicted nuclease with TOPRIM domain